MSQDRVWCAVRGRFLPSLESLEARTTLEGLANVDSFAFVSQQPPLPPFINWKHDFLHCGYLRSYSPQAAFRGSTALYATPLHSTQEVPYFNRRRLTRRWRRLQPPRMTRSRLRAPITARGRFNKWPSCSWMRPFRQSTLRQPLESALRYRAFYKRCWRPTTTLEREICRLWKPPEETIMLEGSVHVTEGSICCTM
jgi:hypothetical protein